MPLLHLAQEQDGYVADDAMAHIAELIGVTPAEVLGTCSFYEMFKREPVGKYLVNVCTNISCLLLGGEELLHHARAPARHQGRAAPQPTACSPSRTSSASPRAPRRRASRSTTATSTRSPRTTSTRSIDDLRHGRRGPRGAEARRPRPHPPAAPADRRAGNAVPGECEEPVWLRTPARRRRRRRRDRSPTPSRSSPPASTSTTGTRSSATSPPAATRACKAALAMAPDRGRRRGQGGQPPRPRRRRLPRRHQVGLLPARACGRATSS